MSLISKISLLWGDNFCVTSPLVEVEATAVVEI